MDGYQLKEEGINLVLSHANPAWKAAVEAAVMSIPVGTEVTGEDIRKAVGQNPHHPNAWGGMISGLVKRGLLVPVGKVRAMRIPSSHARKAFIYRVER